MIDLLHVKTFITVATTKNFNRAAAILGYSQSSVTHHVKMLERELGAPLFERFRFARNIALTDAGRSVLGYSQRLVALAEETKAAAAGLGSSPVVTNPIENQQDSITIAAGRKTGPARLRKPRLG